MQTSISKKNFCIIIYKNKTVHKKINFLCNLLLLIILFYLAYKFAEVKGYNITAVEKAKLLNVAADNFVNFGFIICIVSCIWVNVLILKTKQLLWLCFPFLFTLFVSLVMTWQSEYIFIYDKQNGMWKGDFSLSYFLGIVIIFLE